MIHDNLDKFDLTKLNNFDSFLTIGSFEERKYFKYNSFKFEKKEGKLLVELSLTKEIEKLIEKNERTTLSFVDKNQKEFRLIYDNDSFVSYIYPSHFVMKMKKVCKNEFEITSFLKDENEN